MSKSCVAKACEATALPESRLCRLHYLKQSWANIVADREVEVEETDYEGEYDDESI
jgi:hypothetical protein